MRILMPVIVMLCGLGLLVCGTVADGSASLTISGTVISTTAPNAEFAANQSTGLAPLSVQFIDLSTGSPTEWEWDFESDGTIDATSPYPTHIFSLAGTYSVSLTVQNTGGADTELKPGYITVQESDPAARIHALKRYIQDLPISSWAHWSQWFLIAPLDRALDQLKKGHAKPAINQMNVFMNFVDLLHSFGVFTDEQASYMTGEATAIIGLIKG